jgi:predicted MFS family arabinose efflux permease
VNLAIAPAWNHWMALLVPASRRATYFARRNRVLHVCMLAGLAMSGFFLQHSAVMGAAVRGFVIVVLLGGAMRLVSAVFLALQDAPRHAVLERAISFPGFLKNLRQGPGRILVFLWLMNVAVALSAPYSVPYLLSDLGMSYTSFMLVTGTAFLAKSLTTGVWGRLVQRLGARRSFLLASLLIIPTPALWVLTKSTHWLVVLQIMAGSAWAGFELCQFLLFYDLFPEKRLSDAWSYYSLVNGVVMVIGTVLGGVVLEHGLWPGDHFTGNPYHLVFVTSTSLRLVPLPT